MKSARRINLYLIDMITSIERIMEYTDGLNFQKFETNFMVVDAVARNFEIIGEASRKIPKEIQLKYSMVPWEKCTASEILLAMNTFVLITRRYGK